MDSINANIEYYRDRAKKYDAEEQPFTHQGIFLASLLKRIEHFNGNQMLLDFGVGTGAATCILGDTFPLSEIHGIDVSNEMLQIAKLKYPRARLKVFDGIKIPFPDNYFDGVLISSVLHHIKDYKTILCEITRVCKECSWILIAQESNPRINKIANIVRKLMRKDLPQLQAQAEYHQYCSKGGIASNDIVSILSENHYSSEIILNNHPLFDVLCMRHNSLYNVLKNTYILYLIPFYLAYNVLATRKTPDSCHP